jgi:hypothetical protein
LFGCQRRQIEGWQLEHVEHIVGEYLPRLRKSGRNILGHVGLSPQIANAKILDDFGQSFGRYLATVNEGLTVPIDGLYTTVQDIGITQHDPALQLA